jgi:hypothetical protein
MFEVAWVRASYRPVLGPASVAMRIALALGVVYLMVAKSDGVESLIVLALALALGGVAATRMKPISRVSCAP